MSSKLLSGELSVSIPKAPEKRSRFVSNPCKWTPKTLPTAAWSDPAIHGPIGHLYRTVATAALLPTKRPGKNPGMGAGKAPGDDESPPIVASSVNGTERLPTGSEKMASAERLTTRRLPLTSQNPAAPAAVWIHPDAGDWRTSLPCSACASSRTPDPSAGKGRREPRGTGATCDS